MAHNSIEYERAFGTGQPGMPPMAVLPEIVRQENITTEIGLLRNRVSELANQLAMIADRQGKIEFTEGLGTKESNKVPDIESFGAPFARQSEDLKAINNSIAWAEKMTSFLAELLG